MNHRANTLPDSLRRYLDQEESVARREGTVTFRVLGRDVLVTVRLRPSWAMLLDWTPTESQERRIRSAFRALGKAWDFTAAAAIIGTVVYLAIQICLAFLPGGAVDRVLGGF